MSMRTWERHMAHEKAKRFGGKKVNKPQYFDNRKQPSLFALHWRDWAKLPLPKPPKKKKKGNA